MTDGHFQLHFSMLSPLDRSARNLLIRTDEKVLNFSLCNAYVMCNVDVYFTEMMRS